MTFSASAAHLTAMRGDDTKISWDPVSALHLHQVSCHNLLSIDLHLLALPNHQGLLQTGRSFMPKMKILSIQTNVLRLKKADGE